MPDELLVLGSSCGLPTEGRFTSAYALSVAGKLFLLDCGAPVSSLLYHYGLDPIDVQAVFLSHWHMDHVAGLGLFLTQNDLRRRPGPLAVYGPRGTRGKIRRLLTDSFVLPDELSYPLQITNIKAKKKYKEALIRVSYFETQHLEESKYKTRFGNKAVAYGLVVNGPGWQLVYSGDLRSPRELSPHIAGCDLLIHEMTHPRAEDVADFAETAKVPHLVISHIGSEFDEAPEKIARIFADRYSGQLTIAEDGTKVHLNKSAKQR
jgi:ribonuclease Z